MYQNSMAWGTRVILSSISVEELDTWAGLLVLSAATLAYLGDASGSFARWVSRAAYDYNSIISNSAPCPFLGDVSGSFVTS